MCIKWRQRAGKRLKPWCLVGLARTPRSLWHLHRSICKRKQVCEDATMAVGRVNNGHIDAQRPAKLLICTIGVGPGANQGGRQRAALRTADALIRAGAGTAVCERRRREVCGRDSMLARAGRRLGADAAAAQSAQLCQRPCLRLDGGLKSPCLVSSAPAAGMPSPQKILSWQSQTSRQDSVSSHRP